MLSFIVKTRAQEFTKKSDIIVVFVAVVVVVVVVIVFELVFFVVAVFVAATIQLVGYASEAPIHEI